MVIYLLFLEFGLYIQRLLQLEKQCGERAKAARKKLLHECGHLRNRLQECSINFLAENGEELIVDSSSLSDALDLLITSDNQIDLLLAEVPFASPLYCIFYLLACFVFVLP